MFLIIGSLFVCLTIHIVNVKSFPQYTNPPTQRNIQYKITNIGTPTYRHEYTYHSSSPFDSQPSLQTSSPNVNNFHTFQISGDQFQNAIKNNQKTQGTTTTSVQTFHSAPIPIQYITRTRNVESINNKDIQEHQDKILKEVLRMQSTQIKRNNQQPVTYAQHQSQNSNFRGLKPNQNRQTAGIDNLDHQYYQDNRKVSTDNLDHQYYHDNQPVGTDNLDHQYYQDNRPVGTDNLDHQYYQDSRPIGTDNLDHQYYQDNRPVGTDNLDHQYYQNNRAVSTDNLDHQFYQDNHPVSKDNLDHQFYQDNRPASTDSLDHQYYQDNRPVSTDNSKGGGSNISQQKQTMISLQQINRLQTTKSPEKKKCESCCDTKTDTECYSCCDNIIPLLSVSALKSLNG